MAIVDFSVSQITAEFHGDLADQHVLPAFEGAQSLEGIARVFTLVSHYIATGTIRKRYPFESSLQVVIRENREGSFETLFEILADPNSPLNNPVIGSITSGVAGALSVELTKYLFRLITGKNEDKSTNELEKIKKARPGDVEALAEAIEPAAIRAHSAINNGANSIIIQGNNATINLTQATKRYLTTNIIDKKEIQKSQCWNA